MGTTRFDSRGCPRVRIIISSDAKNEADDQYAIVHALLTPSFDVRGMIASHFGEPGSMERSLGEIRLIAGLLGDVWAGPVVSGAIGPLEGLDGPSSAGRGVELIISEAMREDDRPLYILCMGPLTDVALVIRACPEVVSRMTVIWVGGGRYQGGGHEANLARDLRAAREVFSSQVALWQIPSEAYKTIDVPVSQLRLRVEPMGEVGGYLYRQLVEFSEENVGKRPWINPESWVLGDQAAVGVLLAEQRGRFEERPAPGIASDCQYLAPANPDRRIRVYRSLDDRMILEDFFCKLELHARWTTM